MPKTEQDIYLTQYLNTAYYKQILNFILTHRIHWDIKLEDQNGKSQTLVEHIDVYLDQQVKLKNIDAFAQRNIKYAKQLKQILIETQELHNKLKNKQPLKDFINYKHISCLHLLNSNKKTLLDCAILNNNLEATNAILNRQLYFDIATYNQNNKDNEQEIFIPTPQCHNPPIFKKDLSSFPKNKATKLLQAYQDIAKEIHYSLNNKNNSAYYTNLIQKIQKSGLSKETKNYLIIEISINTKNLSSIKEIWRDSHTLLSNISTPANNYLTIPYLLPNKLLKLKNTQYTIHDSLIDIVFDNYKNNVDRSNQLLCSREPLAKFGCLAIICSAFLAFYSLAITSIVIASIACFCFSTISLKTILGNFNNKNCKKDALFLTNKIYQEQKNEMQHLDNPILSEVIQEHSSPQNKLLNRLNSAKSTEQKIIEKTKQDPEIKIAKKIEKLAQQELYKHFPEKKQNKEVAQKLTDAINITQINTEQLSK